MYFIVQETMVSSALALCRVGAGAGARAGGLGARSIQLLVQLQGLGPGD